MNKRGQQILTEETMKIIIALICLFFLAFLVYEIYSINQANGDLEKAKASLQHLGTEISAQSEQVEIFNPNNWYLISWPHDYLQEKDILPKQCKDNNWKSCLCICNQFTACGEGGVAGTCIESTLSVIGENLHDIKIEHLPLILSIDYTANTIQEGVIKNCEYCNNQDSLNAYSCSVDECSQLGTNLASKGLVCTYTPKTWFWGLDLCKTKTISIGGTQ